MLFSPSQAPPAPPLVKSTNSSDFCTCIHRSNGRTVSSTDDPAGMRKWIAGMAEAGRRPVKTGEKAASQARWLPQAAQAARGSAGTVSEQNTDEGRQLIADAVPEVRGRPNSDTHRRRKPPMEVRTKLKAHRRPSRKMGRPARAGRLPAGRCRAWERWWKPAGHLRTVS